MPLLLLSLLLLVPSLLLPLQGLLYGTGLVRVSVPLLVDGINRVCRSCCNLASVGRFKHDMMLA
jgi:hypothetical protein